MPLISRPKVGPAATVLARSPIPPAELLTRVAEYPLPAMFLAWGPFPGVTRVEGQEGRWDRVGRTRAIHLSDGAVPRETVIEYTAGHGFAYELVGFTDVFGRLIHGVRGEWGFAPDGDGTVVRWTWEFAPRFGRRALVALVIVPLWRLNMQRMIRAAIRELSR